MKPENLGIKIRELREANTILLRQIAAYLEVDTALISKIERGDRYATKEQVIKIADFFSVDRDQLIILWLVDKVEIALGEDGCFVPNVLNIIKIKLTNEERTKID